MSRPVTVLLAHGARRTTTGADPGAVAGSTEPVRRLERGLAELDEYRFQYLDDHHALVRELANRSDFVLNLASAGYRNDRSRQLHIPALLELLGLPYSGPGPACLALCQDRSAVRAIAAAHGLPVPHELFLQYDTDELPEVVPLPAVVKLARSGNSGRKVGAAVARDKPAVERRVAEFRRAAPGQDLLVQEALEGTAYSLVLIGNPGAGFIVLPPLEVQGGPKTAGPGPRRYRPAELDDGLRLRLVERATLLFERLGCRDCARFDFRADEAARVRLLKVVPAPAWHPDARTTRMAELRGWTYAELLRVLLETALQRLDSAAGPPVSRPTEGTPAGPHPAPAPGRPR